MHLVAFHNEISNAMDMVLKVLPKFEDFMQCFWEKMAPSGLALTSNELKY
jgi:hypothetical protein